MAAIAGFYRDDLGMVFLGPSYYLKVPILYLPTFSGFSGFSYFSKDAERCRNVRKCFENV